MKKYLSVLLAFCLIFLLFGCQFNNKHYIEENGNYYLAIDNLPTVPSNEDIGAMAVHFVLFANQS